MKSHVTVEFRQSFANLPDRIKRLTRKNYKIWKNNPHHPGIQFKKVGLKEPIYSVRIGLGWRALGIVEQESDTIIWFWIGSHAEYDKTIKSI